MKPYDPAAHCAQCGGEDVSTAYHGKGCAKPDCSTCHEGHKCGGGNVPHMQRYCRRCGYEWHEAPLATC